MSLAINPIIRGFNPDPSIIRVVDDYYIATSTFEWFPGIQIHHSKDLVNWNLYSRILTRKNQLDLTAVTDSGGAWAPCLSYYDGTFYLVYSNVKNFDGVWKDTPNYLVTATHIDGPWSDPIFLNAKGFDGSLFHNEDGRHWYVSMIIDHRKSKFFGGIIMQEYDLTKKQLIGEVRPIFKGTKLGLTEGPHLYKKGSYYYLITAEGGTEYNHAVSIARSKNIEGPYQVHPQNPILTCKEHPDNPLQKSGHGDFVVTKKGKWFMVFLVGRPLSKLGRCTLGRETAIEEFIWKDDDWPYLKRGGNVPGLHVEMDSQIESLKSPSMITDHFDKEHLSIHFQSLRVPITKDWCDLESRLSHVRLIGRESPSSKHKQSLIARRVQHFNMEAFCSLDFNPEHFQHLAGLICYYNTYHYYYLNMSANELGEKVLSIIAVDKYQQTDYPEQAAVILSDVPVELKVHFNHFDIQFYYKQGQDKWQAIGPRLDGSILSDEYVQDASARYRAAFTGAFVGICVQDLTGQGHHADFDYFSYRKLD